MEEANWGRNWSAAFYLAAKTSSYIDQATILSIIIISFIMLQTKTGSFIKPSYDLKPISKYTFYSHIEEIFLFS
jgi:hypothetical protein